MDNIILIGFMGCGKSSIGRFLEKKHGYKLIDTDDYIEKKQNRSINDIFATDGEEYFRNLETECIRELIDKSENGLVIAVGGGLPMRSENQTLLKKLGKVVYLRATEDTLVDRLTGDSKRPLLKGGDLRTKIQDLFARREETYVNLADLIVDTDDCSYETVYKSIKERL